MYVLQSYYNRERCIEMLAKECQKYQNMVCNRFVMVNPVSHSTEDILPYDSTESLSSVSSGHSAGAQTNNMPHSLMRSSQSYTYIPLTESSGHVHDPTPRSSLPMPSLDVVPPSQHLREINSRIPATAAVMQHGPFTYMQDAQLNRHSALRQDDRVEVVQNLPSCNLLGETTAAKSAKTKTVTVGVSYKVNCSGNSSEQSKPTYLSATHVNMPASEEGEGKLGAAAAQLQNRLSDSVFPTASSNCAYTAVYINPQQVWVTSQPKQSTYVSSLSAPCEYPPSVTGGNPSLSSSVPTNNMLTVPAYHSNHSPRHSTESVDNTEYTNGRKCVIVFLTLYSYVSEL